MLLIHMLLHFLQRSKLVLAQRAVHLQRLPIEQMHPLVITQSALAREDRAALIARDRVRVAVRPQLVRAPVLTHQEGHGALSAGELFSAAPLFGGVRARVSLQFEPVEESFVAVAAREEQALRGGGGRRRLDLDSL